MTDTMTDTMEQQPKPKAKKHKFPTEIINLPSKGILYPEGHPLASGEVELKYMTAKEEDILTSTNLVKKGLVMDKLLEAVIVTPFDLNDLLLVDKDAILISTRILGYGNMYEASITCPECGNKSKISVDLNDMDVKDVDEALFTPHVNEFSFELPKSKLVVTWKLMTHGDQQAIREEAQALQRFEQGSDMPQHEVTSRLRRVITSVDGDTSPGRIKAFVENELIAMDSRSLRTEIGNHSPEISIKSVVSCQFSPCTFQKEVEVPIGIDFFWPDA